MSTAKFEKLFDLIINEDEERAKQLFHEIVVEKSRELYENMMEEEAIEEGVSDLHDEISMEESGELAEDDMDSDEPVDMDSDDHMDMDSDDHMDMDSDDDMDMDSDDMDDAADDMEDMDSSEDDLEDRVVDLEDKLDDIIARFEREMGDDSDEDSEEDSEEDEVMESVAMKAVPKPKHGDDGAHAKSPVAANSGKAGMSAKPNQSKDTAEKGRPAPAAKEHDGGNVNKVGGNASHGGKGDGAAPKAKTEKHTSHGPISGKKM